MRVFDASSIVYGWDNYPIQQFPALWEWIADQIKGGTVMMSRVAFDEVTHVAPDCANWLKDNDIERLDITNEVVQSAMQIKNDLGVRNDDYHVDGIDENDLLIIATAKVESAELISNEARQTSLPSNIKRFKIPAVCAMPGVGISCINFIDYIKQSNRVFG